MKCSVLFFTAIALVLAQDAERVSVPLTDPSRPATVRIESMRGDITVRGHEAKDVIVMSKSGDRAPRRGRRGPAELEGLKRIDLGGGSFTAEERDNVVTVGTAMQGSDVEVHVPRAALLKLKTMSGDIVVDGVRGEIEANSMNGEVTITAAEGSVVAHSLNGDVKVVLNRVEPKPMSFSTMNGDIDVTLPPDTKARLKLRNDHGEVYSDFELKVQSTPQVEQGSRENGKYKVKFERSMTADLNGGGPEISFRSVNGKIKIRQRK
jgi:DUF4097 and DUF4098 domain-containing protein YvlB